MRSEHGAADRVRSVETNSAHADEPSDSTRDTPTPPSPRPYQHATGTELRRDRYRWQERYIQVDHIREPDEQSFAGYVLALIRAETAYREALAAARRDVREQTARDTWDAARQADSTGEAGAPA